MNKCSVLVFLLVPFLLFAKVDTLSTDTLSKWITSGSPFDFLLIDVRDTSETTTIIATETCRPYHLSYNKFVFDSTIAKLPKNVAIILYCASGNRSGKAAQKLDVLGFVSVHSLKGGFGGWKGSTKPYSYCKPASDLPAPSVKSATALLLRKDSEIAISPIISCQRRTIVCNRIVAKNHILRIVSLQGKCVVVTKNPFSHQRRFLLPGGIASGWYQTRIDLYDGSVLRTTLHVMH